MKDKPVRWAACAGRRKRGGLRVETCFSARKNFFLYAYNLKTELLAVYPKSLFLQPKALFLQTELLF